MNGAAQNLRSHSCSLLRNCFCSYKTQENIAHNMFILIKRGGERFFWLGLSFMHWRVADSGQSPYTKLPSPQATKPRIPAQTSSFNPYRTFKGAPSRFFQGYGTDLHAGENRGLWLRVLRLQIWVQGWALGLRVLQFRGSGFRVTRKEPSGTVFFRPLLHTLNPQSPRP